MKCGGLDPTPDLDNKSTHNIHYQDGSGTHHTPFTVPEDGWIVGATDEPSNFGSRAWQVNSRDAFGTRVKVISSQSSSSFTGVTVYTRFIPYPVKKGDVVDVVQAYTMPVACPFASCRGNSAKTN